MTASREALAVKTAQASTVSEDFDFESEGSLATFWRQATPGTTYWRGYLPMKYLPGSVVKLEADSVLWDEEAGEVSIPSNKGTAIWQFLGDDGRGRIALSLKRTGVHTLMELDDAYLRYAPTLYGKHGAWTKTHAEAMTTGNGYSVEMHRKTVPQMDGLIVATDNLADQYDDFLAKQGSSLPIYVCQNSVDPGDWDVQREESEVLRIGYYGSQSHLRDWPLAKKAMRWAARQPGVEVVLIGFCPPGWTGRVLPWSDNLFAARANLGHLDVGIAPLTVNPWSSGKSDVKALEYAMAGVMPILQDAPPYAPWKDAGWEWFARTEDDWADIVREIVANRDLVPLLAAEAKKYVLDNRTIQKSVDSWREAVSGA